MTPPFKNFPIGIRLMLFFSLFFFNLEIVTIVVSSVLHSYFGFSNPLEIKGAVHLSTLDVNGLVALEAFSSIGGFMLTAMMFAVLERGEFKNHLGLNRPLQWKMILLGVFSIVAVQFFISYLADMSNKIPLPASMQAVKDAEKQIADVTGAFLDFKSFRRFILVSFVMAVLPAIGEEMFFRGLLMGDLLKARVKPAAAIILSGLIFALFHFEFQNTLSIWILGCFLGYLYYITGSLWLPILVHFTNNFLDVLLKYLYNTGVLKSDVSDSSVPLYWALISLVVFGLCFFIFNKWKVQPSFVEEELPNEEVME